MRTGNFVERGRAHRVLTRCVMSYGYTDCFGALMDTKRTHLYSHDSPPRHRVGGSITSGLIHF